MDKTYETKAAAGSNRSAPDCINADGFTRALVAQSLRLEERLRPLMKLLARAGQEESTVHALDDLTVTVTARGVSYAAIADIPGGIVLQVSSVGTQPEGRHPPRFLIKRFRTLPRCLQRIGMSGLSRLLFLKSTPPPNEKGDHH